jgi:putative effector of murein hydrolase LrgA (UPF0299 family)
MGQLLLMLLIPPLVGVVTYAVVRLFWEKDAEADQERAERR